jgi:hypothetical protein
LNERLKRTAVSHPLWSSNRSSQILAGIDPKAIQFTESVMRTTILALTLVAAFAAPAFAESEKAVEAEHQQATPAQEHPVEKAPAQVNDPDWKPCKYQSERDPNGCE